MTISVAGGITALELQQPSVGLPLRLAFACSLNVSLSCVLLVGIKGTRVGATSVPVQASDPVNVASGSCGALTSVPPALRRRTRRLDGAVAEAVDVTLSVGLQSSGLPALSSFLSDLSSPQARPLSAFEAAAASAAGLPPSSIRVGFNASGPVVDLRSSAAAQGTAAPSSGLGIPVVASIAAGGGVLLLCVAAVAVCVIIRRRRARSLRGPTAVTDSRIDDELLKVAGSTENPMGARRKGDADDRARDLRDSRHAALARLGSRRVKHEFQATLPSLPQDGPDEPAQAAESLLLAHRRPSSPPNAADGPAASHTNPIGRKAGAHGKTAAIVSGTVAAGAATRVQSRSVATRSSLRASRAPRAAATVQIGADGQLTPLSNPLRSGDGMGDSGPGPRASAARLESADGSSALGAVDNPITARARDHGEGGGRLSHVSHGGLVGRHGDTRSASMAMYASPHATSRAGHRNVSTGNAAHA